jgi:hypothetical protein
VILLELLGVGGVYERVAGLRYKYTVFMQSACVCYVAAVVQGFGSMAVLRKSSYSSVKGSEVDGAMETECAPTEGCDRVKEGCVGCFTVLLGCRCCLRREDCAASLAQPCLSQYLCSLATMLAVM